jgi:hypothetical protein
MIVKGMNLNQRRVNRKILARRGTCFGFQESRGTLSKNEPKYGLSPSHQCHVLRPAILLCHLAAVSAALHSASNGETTVGRGSRRASCAQPRTRQPSDFLNTKGAKATKGTFQKRSKLWAGSSHKLFIYRLLAGEI